MKKLLLTIALLLPLGAFAAPITSFVPNLIPITTATYYLGTTTPSTISWKGGVFDQLCLTADTCRTTWPAGGSGSAGGSDTQVQFNDGGTSFGGSAFLTFTKGNGLLTSLSALFTNATTTNFLATGSSTLQNFTGLKSTTTNATTTSISTTIASTTKLWVDNLGGAGTTCLQASQAGLVTGTGSACGAGGGGGGNAKFATTSSTVDPLAIFPNGGVNTLVGIGTTTPHWSLQVASSTGPQLTLTDVTSNTHLSLRQTGSTLYIASSSYATFATSTTEAFALDTNGQAGLSLGTSTVSATLNIGTETLPTGIASTTKPLYIGFAGSTTPSLAIDSPNNNGGVMIATSTTPSTQQGSLRVGGKIYWSNANNVNTGDYICYNTLTGELDQSGTACSLSSLRFKTNIQAYPLGLEAVLKLRPVTFNFKEGLGKDTRKTEEGFIAEEVFKIDPSLVGYDAKGQVGSLDYPKFVVMLTKAVQELNAKVDDQFDKWPWFAIGILAVWNVVLTIKLKKK